MLSDPTLWTKRGVVQILNKGTSFEVKNNNDGSQRSKEGRLGSNCRYDWGQENNSGLKQRTLLKISVQYHTVRTVIIDFGDHRMFYTVSY
jgi:hypothetical protein